MKTLGCEVPHKIQVLIYMSKISGPGLDCVAQDISVVVDLDKVNVKDIEHMVRLV
jgi:hypothetical protein